MDLKQVQEATAYLRGRGIEDAVVAVILGTGLGNLANRIDKILEIPYESIPHFPVSTVEFHSGKLIYGKLAGRRVLALQGRFHAYEGYTMQQVVFPVRVLKMLGIRQLLISNAAGSLNPMMKKGTLMVIDDHINLQTSNPLTGRNIDDWGPRFPDLSCPYDPGLNKKLLEIAAEMNLPVSKGIYVAVMGPNLETRAEYRFLRMIGADVVGMSTVPEVIVANHMKLPVAAVSVITDECDPDHLKPVDISEIIETAGHAEKHLTLLFEKLIAIC